MDWLRKGKLPFCFENIAYALEEEMKAVQKQDSLGVMENFHFWKCILQEPSPALEPLSRQSTEQQSLQHK